MKDETAETPPRTTIFSKTVQAGQLLQVIPMLGVLGLLLKLIWIAGATYTAFTDGLLAEQAARVAAESELTHKFSALTDRLADKIDATTAMENQKLSALNDKVTDLRGSVVELKSSLTDLVRASTPSHR